MKITIIHGEDKYESRRFLDSLLSASKIKILRYNLNSTANLQGIFRSKSLFEEDHIKIFYESESLKTDQVTWLSSNATSFQSNVIFYSENKLPEALIKKFDGRPKIYEFKLSKTIWVFLESFYPGNSKACINYLLKTEKEEPVEKIFTILVSYIKDLYLTKIASESLDYQSWRLNKLKNQSSRFSLVQLRKLIGDLGELDLAYKTSSTDLASSLDLLVIRHLK